MNHSRKTVSKQTDSGHATPTRSSGWHPGNRLARVQRAGVNGGLAVLFWGLAGVMYHYGAEGGLVLFAILVLAGLLLFSGPQSFNIAGLIPEGALETARARLLRGQPANDG